LPRPIGRVAAMPAQRNGPTQYTIAGDPTTRASLLAQICCPWRPRAAIGALKCRAAAVRASSLRPV
jgi:hypothetical protein